MDSRRPTIPNYYPEELPFEQLGSNMSEPFNYPYNDHEIVVIDTFDISDFRSPYDPGGSYELASTEHPTVDQWEGGEEWQPEPQASASQALPFAINTSEESSTTLPWYLIEDEPHMGTTVNPRDVWDISASTSSIDHTVDEGKPLYEYKGSPPAPSNLNLTYYPLPPEPKADRASIIYQESGVGSSQSSLATVRDSNFEIQNCLPVQDESSAGPSSRKATSSSSVITSTKGVKRSLEDSDHSQDLVDVNGDHQIAKPERKDGRSQCLYSKCSATFKRASDRDRHVKSARHLNILGSKCPKPYCLFEGARPDVISRHLKERGHGNESQRCTCGAEACERARGFKRARKK